MIIKKSQALFVPFALSLGVIFWGCSTLATAPKPTMKYAIHYSPSPSVFTRKAPAVIKVDHFGAAPGYGNAHMVYSTGPFKRSVYTYHQWFSPPSQMIAHALIKDLRAQKAFTAITLPGDGIKATHVLTGGVTDFYERDDTPEGVAVLGISILLFTEPSLRHKQQVLLERQYTTEIACKEKTAPAFAAAMNRAVQSLSDQIITDVFHAVSGQAKQLENAEK